MVAVDANGADAGAAIVAEGALRSGVEATLFGPASELGELVRLATPPLDVVDAPDAIEPDEEPARAVRSKPTASVVQAARAVAEGRHKALVSAGPTGAALAASLFQIKRLSGVHRPALAVLLPVPGHPTLLLDAGANVEVRPEQLVQFAEMGATFMETVHGVSAPRVGLLSVGEEPQKGTAEVIESHRRLATSGALNFIGNIEGGDVPAGVCDVVVTDGFTGNVAIKLMEGTTKTLASVLGGVFRSSPRTKIGGLLVAGKLQGLRRELDPETTGGAILLGLRAVVVIAHGNSGSLGIANAMRLARRAVDQRMVDRTAAALDASGALRSTAAVSVSAAHD